ncbi:MAG: nitroreductase family protein [Caulobacteraceae bacterium]
MDVYEAIFSRRTVRDFKDRAIERDILEKIIDAGLQAPSNNHMRQWEFIILDNGPERLRAIEKVEKNLTEGDALLALDNWGFTDKFQCDMYIDAIPKQYRMLLDSGSLIIPCFRQKSPLLKPDSLSGLNGFASIWCCIENMLLAAVAEGIYGVTRIPDDEETVHIKTVLNIPDEYEVPCYLALGYPEENKADIKQHTIKASERMHYNTFRCVKI